MKTTIETRRRETFANGPRGRIRRNERRKARRIKESLGYMAGVES